MANDFDKQNEDELHPLYRLAFRSPFLRARKGRLPFVKFINWFTGVGKTYSASSFAHDILHFIDDAVIPIYIAPMIVHINGFHAELIKTAAQRNIVVYQLLSDQSNKDDMAFYDDCRKMAKALTNMPELIVKIDYGKTPDKIKAHDLLVGLQKFCIKCQSSPIHTMARDDELYEFAKEDFEKTSNRALADVKAIMRKIIEIEEKAHGSLGLYDNPIFRALLLRLFPLQLFIKNPGILTSTAMKIMHPQQVYVAKFTTSRSTQVQTELFGAPSSAKGQIGTGFRWEKFDTVVDFTTAVNGGSGTVGNLLEKHGKPMRFCFLIDEEEDSYWQIFDKLKSVINPDGRHDLNLVLTEFFRFFDLEWPLHLERKHRENPALAAKIYRHLPEIGLIARHAQQAWKTEITSTGRDYLLLTRQTALLRRVAHQRGFDGCHDFNDEELGIVITDLIMENDHQSDFERFDAKTKVFARLKRYISAVVQGGAVAPGSDYSEYKNLVATLCNKKLFTMKKCTYGEMLEQPRQTFFDDALHIMDVNFLRQIEITSGRPNEQLNFHDAGAPKEAITLFHYLKLILLIAGIVKDKGFTIAKEEREDYKNLDRFRKAVKALFGDEALDSSNTNESYDDALLDEKFIFNDRKNIISLQESARPNREFSDDLINLTLVITSLNGSPEAVINDMIATNNMVYIMSATGGLSSATGGLNLKKICHDIQAKNGFVETMTMPEIEAIKKIVVRATPTRKRLVTIFNHGDLPDSIRASRCFIPFLRDMMAPHSPPYILPNKYKCCGQVISDTTIGSRAAIFRS
jgi:hypothetical protein